MADQPLQRQRSATQRRVEDAVGGIGVIESGLPPRVRRKDSNLRSSDLVSERSAPSQGGARGRGTVRTNRRMSLMVGRASRETGNEILPEGRARVAKCEVAESRFCGVAGIAGKGARKTILHPLRVDVPPGSVTAILGTAERYVGYLMHFVGRIAKLYCNTHSVDTSHNPPDYVLTRHISSLNWGGIVGRAHCSSSWQDAWTTT